MGVNMKFQKVFRYCQIQLLTNVFVRKKRIAKYNLKVFQVAVGQQNEPTPPFISAAALRMHSATKILGVQFASAEKQS